MIASTRTTVRETVDAKQQRIGAKDLAVLFSGAKKIVVCKGAKTIELDPSDSKSLETVLGPTGNLRAPTARFGNTWIVGFGEATWKKLLAG